MEYRFTPTPQNKKAAILVSLLFSLALLSIVGSMAGLGPQSLWQSAFLILVSLSMFFWLRYFSTKYIYTVTDAYGTPMLIVTGVQGKRISTLCRVELYRISDIDIIADAESEEGKRAGARFKTATAKYSYMATVFPRSLQVLYGTEGGQPFAVRIEADEGFLSVLKEQIERAKREKPTEDEEDE